MAYYLDVQASNLSGGYVAFPSYSIADNADFSIKFRVIFFDLTGYARIMGRAANISSDINIDGRKTLILQNASGASVNVSLAAALELNTMYDVEVARSAGSITFSAGGQTATGALGGAFDFDQFFKQGGSTTSADFGLALVEFDSARRYENTTGTGSVMPDSIGSQDGNLVDYPVDNTQWVPYTPPAEPVAALTVTQTELTPGGTISGTYADYATIPTTLTVSDGTNTIAIPTPTITDNGDGTGSFSGTMPALPATGTANLVLFGDVTVELS